MKLKLSYQPLSGGPVDLVVTTDATATIGDIAQEIRVCDPRPGPKPPEGDGLTLSVASPGSATYAPLDPDSTVGESSVTSGYQVRLTQEGSRHPAAGQTAHVELAVESGPEQGKRFRLRRGSHLIGRDPGCAVMLTDPLVSKNHARLQVGDVVELVDLNSANGLLVDGGLVSRLTIVDGQAVTLGDTVLRFALDSRVLGSRRIRGAAVAHTRSPRVELRYPGREFAAPDIPGEYDKPIFPWLLMIVPILMGGVLYAVTRSPLSLVFVAMSPMMMLANYAMGAKRANRAQDSAVRRFDEQMQALTRALDEEVPRERQLRAAETPALAALMDAGRRTGELLWTRRPEHWSFLHLRLGVGQMPSRNGVADPGGGTRGLQEYVDELERLVALHRFVNDVPVVEDLVSAGVLGVVGSRETSHDVARGLLMQLVTLHSPAELVVAAITSVQAANEYEWLKWLPHTSSPLSPLTGSHLADSAATAAALLANLEEVVGLRASGSKEFFREHRPALEADVRASSAGSRVGEKEGEWEPPKLPVVVLLVTADAPVDSGRLIQLLERAGAADVYAVMVAADVRELPAVCRTFVNTDRGLETASVSFVRHGSVVSAQTEGVSRAAALDVALSLSGVVDTGAFVADSSDLPQNVSMLSLLGPGMASSGHAVVDRWRQNFSLREGAVSQAARKRPPTLRALVGQAGADAMHLDLRSHGPHALVGGTTGSGKSEFLQSWVLGMAAEYSPDQVTFLFVDYKGGAAFSDCVALPHCVGLVTDLSPHLVVRVLASLRAELRHRERVLNRKKAKDLLELEKRGDPECPPALVLVIDEFAALVGEVPEFVDGVVDIAQRGRSLGIHLIMATQRPAGVIRDNLRANTNLRIALRMADESDSDDVVGSQAAASFDPAIPGRAMAKTGPGRLVQFQSAYSGGWSLATEERPSTSIHELRFGADRAWDRPEEVVAPDEDLGPNDQLRLVKSISEAAVLAGVTKPRRPWLDELRRTYDLAALGPRTDTHLALGMCDLPDDQEQQPIYFLPEEDGHLAVYGTGGSGKTVLLRTLAAGAGITPSGGPVEVYGLDFGTGGLRMLEVLPHVGSVIPGDDSERVVRLLRTLKAEIDRRGTEFSRVDADSITAFRRLANRPDEPRILLLIDGFPSFRNDYESVAGRSQWYGVLQQLLSEGRQLGLHVILTADRPASVPGSVGSSIPRRVVLRMAEETMYTILDVPSDILGPSSPPGRAVVDGKEVQIAVLGGSPQPTEQSAKLASLAADMRAMGRREAAPVQALPTLVPLSELPDRVGDLPVLAISDENLEPVGFKPEGVFLIGGGPGSGRSNALHAMVRSLHHACPDTRLIHVSARRTPLSADDGWSDSAWGIEQVAELARSLNPELTATSPDDQAVCLVIEGLSELQSSAADGPVVELIRTLKRGGHFVIAESETSTWSSSFPLYTEIKSARRGVLLQPEPLEGELILKASFPRGARSEFPPGRGYLVQGGKVVRVQFPVA